MKKLKVTDYDDKQFINSTHKVNLTGGEISTILYHLEECNSTPELERIFVELQSITDTWYEENQHTY